VVTGHGFVQILRRGHYELAVEQPAACQVAVAFDEFGLGDLIVGWRHGISMPRADQTQQNPWTSSSAGWSTRGAPPTDRRSEDDRPSLSDHVKKHGKRWMNCLGSVT
jgi:hypothetical protein